MVPNAHSLRRSLPPARPRRNRERGDPAYPGRLLSGVRLAFDVRSALTQGRPQPGRFVEETVLALVALGTVPDLAPLQGENRRLVSRGLEVLNSCRRPGVAALVDVSGLKPGSITAEHISFMLGPRINAAGRLAHAYDAARLLATNNMRMAREYAQALNSLNQRRRSLTRQLTRQAEEMIQGDRPILIAAHPDFISGIVGLLAGRLAEKHYLPAVAMEQGPTESRRSCRSIPEFHIIEALDEVADRLERHGGQAQAAGFTVRNENLEALQARLTEIATDRLAGKELKPTLEIDAELRVSDVDWALQGQLEQLEPTGEANATPLFVSRGVQVYNHRAVGDGSHLQLVVGDGQQKVSCIAFRQGEWAATLPERIDLVYTIGVNEWNGRRDLQLVVQDIRPAEESVVKPVESG
jgi:single-stranded-DNA-specific exonuclease